MKKIEFGSMQCGECGTEVKVMKAENGSLSYRCLARGCDNNDYATAATPLKHSSWLKRIQPYETGVDPVETKNPPPKPAKQPGGHPFFD